MYIEDMAAIYYGGFLGFGEKKELVKRNSVEYDSVFTSCCATCVPVRGKTDVGHTVHGHMSWEEFEKCRFGVVGMENTP